MLASVAVATQRIKKKGKKRSIMLCGKFMPDRYQMELQKKKRIAMFRVSLHPSLKSLVVPVI